VVVTYEEQSRAMRTDGDQVRARRKRMGLRQSELAAQAEITRDTLSDWENGKRNPHPETVEKVLSALDRLEEEMGFHAPPAEERPGLVRYVVKGVYGAESLVVEGPVENITELEASVDRIMRGLRAAEPDS